MPSPLCPALEMIGITKRFPGVLANDDIHLCVRPGTIHALIGENGAGKSTLANILYGRFQPDRGRIILDGGEIRIPSPAEAIRLGIGLVTQHTTLIPALTVLENIVLGAEPARSGIISVSEARTRVRSICSNLRIDLDLRAPAAEVSIAGRQKAEIVKALYRGARLLILDEPTSALAPQEAESLFALMHMFAQAGSTVLFITHKLREVMAHAEHVTVLTEGRSVGERRAADTNPDELLALMIGERAVSGESQVTGGERRVTGGRAVRLQVQGLVSAGRGGRSGVRNVALEVRAGEVVGIAGVDGSGQRELAEAIVGLRPVSAGSIRLDGVDITTDSVARRMETGIAYIPEDPLRYGVILTFTVAENLLLGRQRRRAAGGGRLLDVPRIEQSARDTIAEAAIRASSPHARLRTLSGGNQQKVVVARALAERPKLLVAMQPTRGLDVEATRAIYRRIREATAAGMSVLLFSLDLDELFEVSDRIAVMFNGGLVGVVSRTEATLEGIGRMMVQGAE